MSDSKYNILFVCTSTSTASWGKNGTTGLWLTELVTPYFIFKEAGYKLDICSVKGGEVPCDPQSLVDDGTNDNEYLSTFINDDCYQMQFKNTMALSEYSDEDLKKYACIFLCGGHGCVDDFPNNNDITHAVEYMFETNKGCIASICHGQLGLLDAKLKNGNRILSGKMVCAYSNEEEEDMGLIDVLPILAEVAVEKAGAICMPSAPWRATAVVDGRIVTGKNPMSSTDVRACCGLYILIIDQMSMCLIIYFCI